MKLRAGSSAYQTAAIQGSPGRHSSHQLGVLVNSSNRLQDQSRLVEKVDARGSSDSNAKSTAGVIQKLAAQVELGDQVIKAIHIAGRPKRTYSGTMGDHTSPFIMIEEGLLIDLTGETVDQAILNMKKKFESLVDLPGRKWLVNKPNRNYLDEFSSHFNRGIYLYLYQYQKENKTLSKAFSFPNASLINQQPEPANEKVSILQQMIVEYFSARELIPTSTINIKDSAKNPERGKNKAEGSSIKMLSMAELHLKANPDYKLTEEETGTISHRVTHLFDPASAATWAHANDHIRDRLWTGNDSSSGHGSDDRFRLAWKQHLKTLEQSFPMIHKQLPEDLLELDPINYYGTDIKDKSVRKFLQLIPHLNHTINDTIGLLTLFEKPKNRHEGGLDGMIACFDALTNTIESIENIANAAGFDLREFEKFKIALNTLSWHPKAAFNIVEIWAGKFKAKKDQLENSYKQLKGKISVYIPVNEEEQGNQSSGKEAGIDESNIQSSLSEEVNERKEPGTTEIKTSTEEDKSDDSEEERIDEEQDFNADEIVANQAKSHKTLKGEGHSAAFQVTFGNLRVTDLISDGRTASPYGKAMGDHTTPWVTLVTQIKSIILNKSLIQAHSAMDGWFSTATGLEKEFEYATTLGETIGEKAKSNYLKMLGSYTVSDLQQKIYEGLTYYNCIGGVTKETKVKGSLYRAEHMNIEKIKRYKTSNDKNELKEGVSNLFDGNQRSRLWPHHLKVVSEAYDIPHETLLELYKKKTTTKSKEEAKDLNSQEGDDMEEYNREQIMKEKEDEENWDFENYGHNNQNQTGFNRSSTFL